MRLGVIDLGSNTIRLVVYQWNGQSLEVLENVKHHTRNIKFVRHAQMSKEGLDFIVASVKELMVIARAYDTDHLHIFATASFRNIKNSDDAVSYIENEIEHVIDLHNGDEESLFGFEGMRRNVSLPLEGLSVDIGGASTEITYFKNNKAVFMGSLPMGSLNLFIQHVHNVMPTESEQFLIRLDVQNHLDSLVWLSQLNVKNVIGIGGSARAIMRLHQAKYDINTSIYDIHLSKKRVSELANFNMDQRDIETRLILKAIPDRMTTVIPGAIIIDEIMNLIHADDYAVSLYGVREGYLFNRILKDIEMAKQ